jgi:CBS domain-containing protein
MQCNRPLPAFQGASGRRRLRRDRFIPLTGEVTMIVKDLMVPLEEYSHVEADATLYDAVRILSQAMMSPTTDPSRPRDRGVLVRAEDGRVLGKMSLWDILNGLRPNFEPPIDDRLLWSQWLQPDLPDRARSIRVADLLREPTKDERIEEQAPIDLAVHRLIRGRHLSLLVTRGDDIVGVLRLSDVFRAVNELMSSGTLQPTSA